MATTTTYFGYTKPAVNDAVDADLWGGYLNTDLDDIDADMYETRYLGAFWAAWILN